MHRRTAPIRKPSQLNDLSFPLVPDFSEDPKHQMQPWTFNLESPTGIILEISDSGIQDSRLCPGFSVVVAAILASPHYQLSPPVSPHSLHARNYVPFRKESRPCIANANAGRWGCHIHDTLGHTRPAPQS
jgi:hypothetical protein